MQTAIITGAAGGMGRETAKIMGRDHRVVIADVNEARLGSAVGELADLGIDAEAIKCDITDRASVDGLMRKLTAAPAPASTSRA